MKKLLTVTATANDGRKVRITTAQAQAIEAMDNTRKGGCASVVGYVPTTNWVTSPVQDIQLISHFSTENLYKRRIKAIEAITFVDVKELLTQDEKLRALTMPNAIALFEERKAMLVKSMQKTLEGDDRSDAHRQAHDRCYVHFGDVKVHLETEKGDDSLMHPVTEDGVVFAKSIMVPYLELNVTTRVKGERKVVNSGNPVRMSKAIERCLNKRSVQFKTLSLKADNFEAFRVDGQEFLPEHVASFGDILAA